MNQHQRKFLLDAINEQHKKEKEKLSEREPKEPSLNNYLTAAILDGSFKMRSAESIRSAIRERVRDLGKGEALLTDESWHSKRGEDSAHTLRLPAELLFELPKAYAVELEKYERAMEAWQKDRDALESAIAAMRIKVQVGSDKALESLVDQADTICSMSLSAANRLLLASK